jgi:hypothetical protein
VGGAQAELRTCSSSPSVPMPSLQPLSTIRLLCMGQAWAVEERALCTWLRTLTVMEAFLLPTTTKEGG